MSFKPGDRVYHKGLCKHGKVTGAYGNWRYFVLYDGEPYGSEDIVDAKNLEPSIKPMERAGFKVGDRVRHYTDSVGVITKLWSPKNPAEILVRWDEDLAEDGAFPSNLTKLPPPSPTLKDLARFFTVPAALLGTPKFSPGDVVRGKITRREGTVMGEGSASHHVKVNWSNGRTDSVPVANLELVRPAKAAEVRVTDPVTGGQKGKKAEEYALIPVRPLAEVARVYGYGASKYAANNYRKGYAWSLSLSALQRHIEAFRSGESDDPESGRHHLAHAAFHLFALMEFDALKLGTDDRIKEVAN